MYLIGGSIMDDLAFMVLATPIFFPTVVQLGYDPIWFGILICITLMIGGIIPPIAIYVFILGNITGLPFKTIYKGRGSLFIRSCCGLGDHVYFPGHCHLVAESFDGQVIRTSCYME